MPLLSVIIPTRNRPELLKVAISSLLDQRTSNFELVISDNSDEDFAHLNFSHYVSVQDDPRVSYLKPNNVMSMVDHWNWAIKQGKGRYVTILTDRMVFKREGLSRLLEVLSQNQPNLLCYLHDSLSGEQPPLKYKRKAGTGTVIQINCENILFACSKGVISRYWPRMLNSACLRTTLNEIEDIYGKVFSGIAPDYSFCFRAMDYLNNFSLLDQSLIISSAHSVSNGKSFITKRDSKQRSDFLKLSDLSMSQDETKIFENGFINWREPVPYNIELLEYMLAKNAKISNKFPEIDYESFYLNALARIRVFEKQGVDMSRAISALESFRVKYNINSSSRVSVGDLFNKFIRLVNRLLEKKQLFSNVTEARQFDFDKPIKKLSSRKYSQIVSEITCQDKHKQKA